jgi:pyruvate, water dikinase
VTLDSHAHTARFGELERHATAIAGGKGASLSDMVRAALPVPPGFVVTTSAFASFLADTGLQSQIAALLQDIDTNDNAALERVSAQIESLVTGATLPEELKTQIERGYSELGTGTPVAVRSSAAAEDGAEASFAGQQDTYLNVIGASSVVAHVVRCWASFFGARAIFYRQRKGSLLDYGMAVVVQKMLAPEKSGVMFTVDPVMKNRAHMVIEGAWGLGEAVVSGLVTPDNYLVERTGKVLRSLVPPKAIAIYRLEGGGTQEVHLSEEQSRARVLSEAEIAALVELGKQLETYFGGPQDVEWGIEAGTPYLLQSRPITSL